LHTNLLPKCPRCASFKPSGVEWSVRGMEMGFGMGMGLGMGTGNWTPDADKSLGCRRLSAPAGPRS